MEYSQKMDNFTQFLLKMAKEYVKLNRNIEIVDILSLKHGNYEIFATFLAKEKEEIELKFKWRIGSLTNS